MSPEDWRPALWWKGPVGVAETTYPHPKGWTFEGAHPHATLDTFTIRTLTALIRQKQVREATLMRSKLAEGPGATNLYARGLAAPLFTAAHPS